MFVLWGLLFWLMNSGTVFSADEVSWLKEVTRPPEKIPEPRRRLSPLLLNAQGKPIRTLPEWKKRRENLREAWLKFLGPLPRRPATVKLKVLRREKVGTVWRELVEYEAEPGLTVQGYLLQPAGLRPGEKRPGVVALHQTTRDTIDQIAGVKGPASQQLGLKLAQRGFVVFCPRCFLWQNAATYKEAVARFHRRHPHTLGMGKMLSDAMRGVDVLVSLPSVDAGRIGAAGHSLGAKETLYLAAFDDRIRAAVASEGGIGFSFTNWEAPWYLGRGIQRPGFPRNHHELLALIAPRPFLILAGENGGRSTSDGDRSWPYVLAAQPVYALYRQPVRLGIFNHRQGHAVPPAAFDRLAEWLSVYLHHPVPHSAEKTRK